MKMRGNIGMRYRCVFLFVLTALCAAQTQAQDKRSLKIVVCEFGNASRYVLREFGETGRDVTGLKFSHALAARFMEEGFQVVYPEEVYADFILKHAVGPSFLALPGTRRKLAETFSADYVITGDIIDRKKKPAIFGFGVYEGFLKFRVMVSSPAGNALFETTLQAMGRDKGKLAKFNPSEKKVFEEAMEKGTQVVFGTLKAFIYPEKEQIPGMPAVTQKEAFSYYTQGEEAFKAGEYAKSIELFEKFLQYDTIGIYTKDAQKYIEEAKKKLKAPEEKKKETKTKTQTKTMPEEKIPQKKEPVLIPVSVKEGETITYSTGYVDFVKGVVAAEGKGKTAKQSQKATEKSLAKRAAVVDAHRNLLNIIEGLDIDENTTVGMKIESDKALSQKVMQFIQGAALVSEKEAADGGQEVVLQCALNGKDGLAGFFLAPPYRWGYK